MSLIGKLKSIIGRGDAGGEDRDVTVTVEHEPQGRDGADEGGFEFGEVEDDDGDEPPGSDLESAAIDERAAADDASGDETGAAGDTDGTEGSAGDAGAEGGEGAAVDSLSGIGPAYAERLGEAGIETVADLANADAAAVAEQTDLSEGRVQSWIDQAAEN